MKTFRSFMGSVVLAMACSAGQAVDFKNAVPGETIADRNLSVGEFSVQLPSGQWTLVSKAVATGGNQSNMMAPPHHTLMAAQVINKTVSSVITFGTPSYAYTGTSRWNDDPCKNVTSFIVKSTMNQTMAMPECFFLANEAAASFHSSNVKIFQDLVRWATDAGYVFPDPMTRVYYTKYHGGNYTRLNAYFAGGPSTASALEAWGREAAASLSAMTMRSSAQGRLPEVPVFAAAVSATAARAPTALPAAVPGAGSPEARLRELKGLADAKLITPEEYEEKRKKIVSEM